MKTSISETKTGFTPFVAWVPQPKRYGSYSFAGVTLDGGHFVENIGDMDEAKANAIAFKLNQETKEAAGGYIVVYKYD